MSELIKTDAVVLRKLNYGDTSKIATFYSKDFGRISAIIKGARSPKSRIGAMVDIMNHLELVFYQKETRTVQLVSQVNLLSHYPRIKEDLIRHKYAAAILELILNLTFENEVNTRIYTGLTQILDYLNLGEKDPREYFIKFFLFFVKELGYEIQLNKCSQCGRNLPKNYA
ncbi:MAG: DNA repair protein RecO, partial [Ignavibacteria bacterium RBG_13_36_8]